MAKITLQGKQASSLTDEELEKVEKKIRKAYQKATIEVEEKLKNHLERFADKDIQKRKSLDTAYKKYKSGNLTSAEYREAKRQYEQWYIGQAMTGERWESLKETLAEDMANASKIAESAINGHMADAYAINFNYMVYEFETGTFTDSFIPLYDKNAMEYILREDPDLLPQYKVDIPKQLKWNKQKINSAVMQGILQGESMDKVARRLRSVTNMNYKASIRNARTASGAAANRGKIDSFSRIQKLGYNIRKQWISTLDNRTRHEHRLLMGQTVKLGEPFKVNGYELEYPCDPNATVKSMLGTERAQDVIRAAPEMIYNCRCVIVGIIEGFEKTIEDFDYQQNPKLNGMTLEEWQNAKPVSKKVK